VLQTDDLFLGAFGLVRGGELNLLLGLPYLLKLKERPNLSLFGGTF
jgi:hypothetical protein